jgi:hypothetical protein
MLQMLVAGVLLYQVAVHVPVLYSHRYSVGAPTCGSQHFRAWGSRALGAAPRKPTRSRQPPRSLAATLVGTHFFWNGGMPEPDVFAAAEPPGVGEA